MDKVRRITVIMAVIKAFESQDESEFIDESFNNVLTVYNITLTDEEYNDLYDEIEKALTDYI